MKHLFVILAAIATSIACSSNRMIIINGTATDAALNGQKVYLYDFGSLQKLDSCDITSGKFTLRANADSSVAFTVVVNRVYANVISEPGTVEVILSAKSSVKGTPQNANYEAYNEEMTKLNMQAREHYKILKEAKNKQGMDSLANKFELTSAAIQDKLLAANRDNNLGVMIIQQKISNNDGYSIAQIDSLLNTVSDKAKTFGPIVKIRTTKVNAEKTDAGKMFSDFDAINPDGTPAKLSDYVGKGKYVLVDFWASWCGPCRAEVPNLKNAYQTYTPKGLVILGVNVWDKKDAFEKAMKDLEMPWAQICVFGNNNATDVYGIRGIPQIILFAPDGTIVDRTLRGEAIGEKLAELLDKK